MATRYRVRIDGERQAFAHLIVDSLAALDPDRICAFQVEHPQEDVAHVYVNAASADEDDQPRPAEDEPRRSKLAKPVKAVTL